MLCVELRREAPARALINTDKNLQEQKRRLYGSRNFIGRNPCAGSSELWVKQKERLLEEVRAREGVVIAFSFDRVSGSFNEEVHLPKTSPWAAPFLHLLAGQLLAFETASALGRDVDRPRSLAKSVTVA